jgi:single-stranded DNA-binding protein
MNKVILIGRLTADPIANTTANGNDIAKFSIAASDSRNREEVYFLNCVA